jgi:Fe-S-cluster-containing dehydrogenase component
VVLHDKDLCIGCGYCFYACPFGAPQFPQAGAFGLRGKMDKCTFCAGGPEEDRSDAEFKKYGRNRLSEGKLPAGCEAVVGDALNGATYAAVRTITVKLRRTISVDGVIDLPSATATFKMPIVTTSDATACVLYLPVIYYTPAHALDTIELWGTFSVAPSPGSVDTTETFLSMVQLF